MSDKKYLFLQSLKLNGEEIPRGMIISTAYLEIAELGGPQIEIKIRDVTGTLIDNIRVGYGSIMDVTMGDDKTLFKETFFVIKAPLQQDVVSVMGFAESVRKIKNPTAQPKFFVNKQPGSVLNSLSNGMKVESDSFKKLNTYHLNMGQTPSSLFRQIARDHGALCWFARGKLHMKGMGALAKVKPTLTYELNNPKAEYLINRFNNVNQDYSFQRSRQTRAVGNSMTDGLRTAGDKSLPVQMVSDSDQGILNNRSKFLMPKLDIECLGNAVLTAGMPLKIILHRYSKENRVDESIPKDMVIERVTHFEDRSGYMARMILGVFSG